MYYEFMNKEWASFRVMLTTMQFSFLGWERYFIGGAVLHQHFRTIKCGRDLNVLRYILFK